MHLGNNMGIGAVGDGAVGDGAVGDGASSPERMHR